MPLISSIKNDLHSTQRRTAKLYTSRSSHIATARWRWTPNTKRRTEVVLVQTNAGIVVVEAVTDASNRGIAAADRVLDTVELA
jgi:hypothetical protein